MHKKIICISFLATLFLSACQSDYTPKPRAFPKVEYLKKEYVSYHDDCPYSFYIPTYAKVDSDIEKDAKDCWKNIEFPYYHATLHLTYLPLKDYTLDVLTEQTRKYVYEHTIKAESIETSIFQNDSNRTYGLIYQLEGSTATPFRFYLTDSANHFVDGAFYFNEHTTSDSVAPIQDYLLIDVMQMLNTLKWK